MEDVNILPVDDEPSITRMLEMVLRKEGFRHIYTAASVDKIYILM